MTSGEEVDFWSATVAEFAPLQLSGPELQEKHLKRPPFRFIHEIVSSINERFQTYSEIVKPEFLDVSSIDSKEKKLVFLNDLIDYVAKILPSPSSVSAKKIVSGHEPEKTNAFLRDLALGVRYAPLYKQQQQKQQQQEKPPQHLQQKAEGTAPAAGVGPRAAPPPRSLSESHPKLPPRSSLPRVKAVNAAAKIAEKSTVLETVTQFNDRVKRYNIDLSGADQLKPKDINNRLVALNKEMNDYNAQFKIAEQTKPATMPPEALEMAIARQIETIKQLSELQRENEKLITRLQDHV